MADHERNPKRQRTNLGSGNPHPSTAAKQPTAKAWSPSKLSSEEVAEVQRLWAELGDVGLVLYHFPFRWRAAAKLLIDMAVIEATCAACPLPCNSPCNADCYRIKDRLPKLPAIDT